MKGQIRISGKNLGELKLPNFCPRCFWIKLRCKLPFQIFPGIFSSIDSYSKKITNLHYERHSKAPCWLEGFGELGKPIKVPHFSKFCIHDSETNILVTGAPDEMFHRMDNSYFIVDYKTAKFTDTQDELLPMYEVQLNSYAYIAEKVGFNPVSGLGLIYYEPVTDISSNEIHNLTHNNGFKMHFEGKLLTIELSTKSINPLLFKVREIYEQSIPAKKDSCKDCDSLEKIVSIIT